MPDKQLELWDVWYPFAAATGIAFARGRVDPTNVMWLHSAPEAITVEIRSDDGQLLARGKDLKRSTNEGLPMTKLTRVGDQVIREDQWPNEKAIGQAALLPGGEVGMLKSWWHASDHSEWRWQIELYNHR
jgi:hypothetical protein